MEAVHLPGAEMGQGDEQQPQQGVPAAGGVAGAPPPPRGRAAARGGAQAPGGAEPGRAQQQDQGAVRRGGESRGAVPRVGVRPGPGREMAWREEPRKVRGDDGEGRLLLPGGDEAERSHGWGSEIGGDGFRPQRPCVQQARVHLPVPAHPD